MQFERGPKMHKAPSVAEFFVEELQSVLGADVEPDVVDDTYEIDTDDFSFSFVVDDDSFEIRNIDVRGNRGLGRKVIAAVHDFADNHDLSVTASNVKTEAIGFWRKMNYEEGSQEGEYFRV